MSMYYAGILADVGILVLGALSVYIILSTGQLSLGNAGFMGIGAYLTSWLTVKAGFPLTPSLLIAALVSGVIGVIVGFPALRLKGIYLAMATLGFGEMVRSFFLNFSAMGGPEGFHGMQHVSTGTIWIWAILVLALVMVLETSQIWLEIRAVRDDETAAGLVGLNATRIKVGAFGFGAAVAAIAGGLFAHHHVYIEPGNFSFERSIDFVLAVILGGSTVGARRTRRRGDPGGAARIPAVSRRLAFCCVRRAPDRDAGGAPPGPARPLAVALFIAFVLGMSAMMETPPRLQLDRVSKLFGGVHALTDLSLQVAPRQIVGVIGPNGAGKTTTFNVITGAYRASSGAVMLDGQAVTDEPSYRIARAGIMRTFQNIRLFADMTVWEHLLVAQPPTGSPLQRLLPTRLANPQAIASRSGGAGILRARDVRNRLARSLPYGLQRKVEMARAVTARPRLLLLDEPVAGMNHDEAETIRNLMLKLRDDGLSILLIEHDMAFVMNLCDTLYVLDFGVLIAQGRPDEIRINPAVLDAYLGQAD